MRSRVTQVISIGIILLLLGAVGWLVSRRHASTNSAVTSASPTPVDETANTNPIIGMHADGFTPSAIAINLGQQVCFLNDDSTAHWPIANDTTYTEFNAQQGVAVDDQWCLAFNKVGTWNFHDQLFPSLTGSITVNQP